jgi:tRNA(Ile)-lysidine synthetase-like protein
MNHSSYYNQVKNFFEHYIEYEQPIAIGVSWGSDSIYLLYCIQTRWKEQKREPSSLHIVSCDHNTRENTKNEIQLVQSYCKGNKFFTDKYEGSIFDERRLREWRHSIFVKYSRENNCKFLLLWHHLDDRIETTFLNINRSCGKKWLLWLQVHASHFLDDSLSIVRPLLSLKKEEIMKDINQLKLKYYDDPSNNDINSSQRNMIRSLLQQYFNTEWFYNSMTTLYNTIETNFPISEKTKNIIYGSDNIAYYIHTQDHEKQYLITITHTQRTSDLLYKIYEHFNKSINPRSTTLSTLSDSLNKKSGNKIIYQWLSIQASRYGSIISIIK